MLRYNSPLFQVILLGLVCWACPGMFNALQGMGGGGQVDHTVVDKANTAVYACFAIVGFASGGICNLLGPKLTLFIGTLGFVLYGGSLLTYNLRGTSAFVIASGAILGVCAGLLWTAQGVIMLSYPDAKSKGRYISLFWSIFNIGGVVGGLIPLFINLNHTTAESISNETYIAFIVLMALGAVLCLTLLPPHKVVRDDDSPVGDTRLPDWRRELIATLKLVLNKRLLVLVPLCFSSNFYYTYHFNAVNGFYFNVRTRALNIVIYWTMEIITASLFGLVLDAKQFSRRTRGLLGLLTICVAMLPTWAGAVVFQQTYDRTLEKPAVDWTDPRFAGAFVLYALFGLNDALWQVFAYWLLGGLSDDPQELSRYTGFYKSIQSAGAAIAWAIDGAGVSYRVQVIVNFALILAALPGMIMVICTTPAQNTSAAEPSEKCSVEPPRVMNITQHISNGTESS
ncbi:uncharacterized protein VTP21DRAFT_2957 [Calcarisporiella thermophila]|uniref:uncharacterized protein n=1 Tax=Calcarisporiella thermophila TaxID=911321 RepID=UPI0037433AAB